MKTYFAVIGMLCLILAAWLFARRIRAQFFGVMAVGTVVGHESRELDGSNSYLPVVTFVDAAGKRHQFTSLAGGATKSPTPGATVAIFYVASDPAIAFISGFLHMWAAPVALLVLGAAGILSATGA